MLVVLLVVLVHDIASRHVALLALVHLPALLVDIWLEVLAWDGLLHDALLVVLSLLLVELLLSVDTEVVELLMDELDLLLT